MTERPPAPPSPTPVGATPVGATPLRRMRRVLALAWVAGVVILYLAVRELGLNLGI